MKQFIKKTILKKVWIFVFTFVALFAALSLLVGCNGPQYRAYPPAADGRLPGDDLRPQNRDYHSESDFLNLSTFDTFNVRDTETYGQFLEEIMSLCRQNRNIGMYGEYHSGGSFGSPISSCQWAVKNYNLFSVDLFMDAAPEHNSSVDIEFYAGYNGHGSFEDQWISSGGLEIVGELKYEEDGDFRIVYRPGQGQPRITIRVKGSLEDLEDGDKRSLSATIEYGGNEIGKGRISVIDPEYED